MPDKINIQGHLIGDGEPCFIIAEAGVNHNGSFAMARDLILEAKKAGADCVKFQTFKAERVVTITAPKARYQLNTTDPAESQIEMLRKLELDESMYHDLIQLAAEQNLVFMSTPYNHEDVDFLDEIGIPAFKLASIHIVEPTFLQYVASKRKPMIVSTGMATLAEIDEAVRVMRETGMEDFVLLQCTTNYPSRPEDANLRTIPIMRQVFDAITGYSDHTQTDTACIAATALGAAVIEKHFTLDKTLPGPDQSTSADPAEFLRLSQGIRETEILLGSSRKQPSEVEIINAQGMRRSIVIRHDLPAGTIISEDDLIFKRPATGLRPALVPEILGRKTRHNLTADTLLQWGDLE